MSEPITVSDARKALRMAQRVNQNTRPGNWAANGVMISDHDFIVMARAVLPGMVEYLMWRVSISSSSFLDDYIEAAIAPIIQWARTREEWSR